MKKYAIAVAVVVSAMSAVAQTAPKEAKKELRKEVRVEDNNGVKTLTISTTENGVESKEVYTGAEADKKLQEMEGNVKSERISEDISVTEDNGQKTVRIKKNVNGKVTEEVYTGAEADQKLKELEASPGTKEMKKEEQRIVIKKETHNE